MSRLTTLTPPDWTGPADGVPCCWDTMHGDWDDCTCWAPIYDPPEQEPLLPGGAEVMPTMCADCAYRPGSPERMGNPDAAADGCDLDDLAIGGTRFWCHDGMRRIVAMRHDDVQRIGRAAQKQHQQHIAAWIGLWWGKG